MENQLSLSRKEIKLFRLLRGVKHQSSWGHSIRLVCSGSNITRYHQLVDQLKSQAKDSPEVMEAILGSEALELITT